MGIFNLVREIIFGKNKPTTNRTSTLPTLSNSYALPRHVDDFKEPHIKVLRRLDKHPVNESFTGLMAKEVDIPNFIPILKQLSLIEIVPCSTALSLLKNDALKELLRQHDLKVTGTKKDLVARILENISENNIRQFPAYTDFYALTINGQTLVNDFTKQLENVKLAFFADCIDLIRSRKLNDAYRKICKRNAEMPTPPGLGIDWAKCYYAGLNRKDELMYQEIFRTNTNSFVASATIFSMMSGDKQSEIIYYFNKLFPEYGLSKINSTISADNNIEEIRSYMECGTDKYIFLATLDSTTCPVCGKLDGKVFYTKDAKIGVNCPPMHDGCRCTVISYHKDEDGASSQRRARNPITGKSELVPGNVTYEMWRKKIHCPDK